MLPQLPGPIIVRGVLGICVYLPAVLRPTRSVDAQVQFLRASRNRDSEENVRQSLRFHLFEFFDNLPIFCKIQTVSNMFSRRYALVSLDVHIDVRFADEVARAVSV